MIRPVPKPSASPEEAVQRARDTVRAVVSDPADCAVILTAVEMALKCTRLHARAEAFEEIANRHCGDDLALGPG